MHRSLITLVLIVAASPLAIGQEQQNVLKTEGAASHIAPDSVLRFAQVERPTISAQRPENGEQTPSLANLTPEMWMFMQSLERHDDPKQAVRRKAEARAQARQNRLTARKWFGLSNARPSASTVPMTDRYSPSWGGNGWHEFEWRGDAVPQVTTRHEYYGPVR